MLLFYFLFSQSGAARTVGAESGGAAERAKRVFCGSTCAHGRRLYRGPTGPRLLGGAARIGGGPEGREQRTGVVPRRAGGGQAGG